MLMDLVCLDDSGPKCPRSLCQAQRGVSTHQPFPGLEFPYPWEAWTREAQDCHLAGSPEVYSVRSYGGISQLPRTALALMSKQGGVAQSQSEEHAGEGTGPSLPGTPDIRTAGAVDNFVCSLPHEAPVEIKQAVWPVFKDKLNASI